MITWNFATWGAMNAGIGELLGIGASLGGWIG
jgi:hypothetical protein